MKTAYVNTLVDGTFLVEVQVKKKRIEAFFHSFKDRTELNNFKKENTDTKFIMICPKCNTESERLLALSRRDNKTMICDSCGTNEALEDMMSGI